MATPAAAISRSIRNYTLLYIGYTSLSIIHTIRLAVLYQMYGMFFTPCMVVFLHPMWYYRVTYLAYKAFYPAKIPFPLLHIDTGHNFEETIQYRDELAKKLGADLIVGSVQESIDKGRVKEETGYYASRNKLQTTTLLDTLEEYKFDAAIGGARRDEEKARAKEQYCHRARRAP